MTAFLYFSIETGFYSTQMTMNNTEHFLWPLLDKLQISPSELGPYLNQSQSNASHMLAGRRRISNEHLTMLAELDSLVQLYVTKTPLQEPDLENEEGTTAEIQARKILLNTKILKLRMKIDGLLKDKTKSDETLGAFRFLAENIPAENNHQRSWAISQVEYLEKKKQQARPSSIFMLRAQLAGFEAELRVLENPMNL